MSTTGQAVISVVKMSKTNQQKFTGRREKQSGNVCERAREREGGVMETNGAICEFAKLVLDMHDF